MSFLLRKFGLLVAVVLSLFLGLLLMSALIPALQTAEADRDRLSEVAQDRADLVGELEELESAHAAAQGEAAEALKATIDAEADDRRQQVSDQESAVEGKRAARDDVCSFLQSLPEKVSPFGPNPCEDAQRALEAADEVLATFERNLGEAEAAADVLSDPTLTNEQKLEELGEDGGLAPAERDIDDTKAELAQTTSEETSLREAQNSWAGRVVNLWARSWKWLVWTALLLVLAPAIVRTVSYFLLMPLVKRAHKPIHLAAGSEKATTTLRTTAAQRTLTIDLGAGEVLSARSEFVRPVQGKIRSRLLYEWTAPFISFAAGLYVLSRITGDDNVTSTTLASPDDPDAYLMRIDFTDHPGLVMHPKHVVGVIGAPDLATRWRWGIQSFATWQVRYILFTGSGSLIVQGVGDVAEKNPQGRSTRIEQNLVMGFDSRLRVGVNRTEVFWPYLLGKTPLVDDEFAGLYPLFWQKSTTTGPSNPIARTFDTMFSALGKLLGF